MDTNNILLDVANYYSQKLSEYGISAHGVDWNSEIGQEHRFAQLLKVIDLPDNFSVNDLGCGYGALFEYLTKRYGTFAYNGYDISEAMIEASKSQFNCPENTQFFISEYPRLIADFSVASGIFNVRLEHNQKKWKDYIKTTLDALNKFSYRGFSFNCLTSYSDEHKKKDYLYYADPCEIFDHCKRMYSPNVSLLHDYGLYEFTIVVRKVDQTIKGIANVT